ncbi:Mobile element protein [Enhygromyxa salina]|uniref:Mobile element protein n=1 Tax=Enhygromyxa salina TaxID=215803 RepID=A0A0C2A7A1_9BACT|nr:helix-turn-helix domain-containing protein [Enhygromyxa salina]KIG19338.1 Mobile element protein [Enhygromyxa salina]
MNDDERQKMALWRYAIFGRLVSVRLEHGDLRELFLEAAAKQYEHPLSLQLVHDLARTIETWYYRYHSGGLTSLEPRLRKDRGCARKLDAELVSLIIPAKGENPRRSLRRLISILERAGRATPGELSRSTVHRILVRAGVSGRPARMPETERRSFTIEHAGDLWAGDIKHSPRVIHEQRERKSYSINIIDCATRFIVASRICLDEGTVTHGGVLKEASGMRSFDIGIRCAADATPIEDSRRRSKR